MKKNTTTRKKKVKKVLKKKRKKMKNLLNLFLKLDSNIYHVEKMNKITFIIILKKVFKLMETILHYI